MSDARSHDDGADDETAGEVAPTPAARRLRAGDAERDAVLEVITEAHGAGRLDPDEVDERQKRALRSRFVDELPALIDDLPEGGALSARLQEQADRAAGRGTVGGLAHRGRNSVAPVSPGRQVEPVRSESWADDNSIAIMSGRELRLAPGTTTFRSYALMGGDDVFLADALGPGVEVTLESYAMWAGNTVHVPPGVRIVDRMVNIMAGNDISQSARGDGSNGTVILTGFSLMAGHDIKLDRSAPGPEELGR